ncbi:hypothetical protein AURDEDRAFT_164938 [Auricularia subglabra TFB-10046 SS5]|nr:hypothetical protein AURDEDRAFT_164938 [Auricularia subglabra TFB-10046 SS5]
MTHLCVLGAARESVSVADPEAISSEAFFHELLGFSLSEARGLFVFIRDLPEHPTRRNWLRVPRPFLHLFSQTPFVHVRTLTFQFELPTAISLLFDLLAFMPALRELSVISALSIEELESAPDMPDFGSPAPAVRTLERLSYGANLALQTVATRIIAPSAESLRELELYWSHLPKCTPLLPRLPNVYSVATMWLDDASAILIRQCPALSHLKVSDDNLEDLRELLNESGARIRFLEISRDVDDFTDEDAEGLSVAVTWFPSLRRLTVLTRDRYEASAVQYLLAVCRQRRVRLHFQSYAEAAADGAT